MRPLFTSSCHLVFIVCLFCSMSSSSFLFFLVAIQMNLELRAVQLIRSRSEKREREKESATAWEGIKIKTGENEREEQNEKCTKRICWPMRRFIFKLCKYCRHRLPSVIHRCFLSLIQRNFNHCTLFSCLCQSRCHRCRFHSICMYHAFHIRFSSFSIRHCTLILTCKYLPKSCDTIQRRNCIFGYCHVYNTNNI